MPLPTHIKTGEKRKLNGGFSNNHFPRGLTAASLDTSDKYKIKELKQKKTSDTLITDVTQNKQSSPADRADFC